MTTKNFVVKNGLTTGNIILSAANSNISANTVVANLQVPSRANLGAAGNIIITGGANGQVLTTDGSGNLSWTAAGTSTTTAIAVDNFTGNGVQTTFTLSVTPSSINSVFVNYNGVFVSRESYSLDGANVTFGSAPDNGSSIEITTIEGITMGTGAFTTSTATGNGSTVNYTVSSGVTVSSVLVTLDGVLQTPTTDYTISGTTLTFTTAPASGVAIQIRELSVATATASISPGGSNTYVQFNDATSFGGSANFTFNKATSSLTVSGNISANYFIGNGSTLTNIAGGNVTGQVSNALISGTVYTGSQPNITSLGSLTGLIVSNATGTVDFISTANVSLGSVANIHITGGSNGQVLTTDGAGNLSFANASGGTSLSKSYGINNFLGGF